MLIGCLVWQAAIAQTSVPVVTGATQEVLETRISETEAAAELDDATRAALIELYRRALGQLEQRRAFDAATSEFSAARKSAPGESQRLRAELERIESEAAPEPPAEQTRRPLVELEQELLAKKADLSALQARLTELEDVLEIQNGRADPAREQLIRARQEQAEIVAVLKLPVPENESARLSEARRWAQENEARAIAAEIEMLNQELLSQPMRLELLQVQRDLVSLQATRGRQFVEALEAAVNERRQTEARSAVEEAEETERLAFGKHPLLQEIAQRNTALGEELNQLAASLESITLEENLVTGRVKRTADAFRLARQKLEIAGLTEALGQVLLEQRRGLPDAEDFRTAQERRQQLVVESSLSQIQHQQERAQLRDINAFVDDQLATLSESWQGWLRDEMLELARQRRDLLDKAIAADDSYLQALGELDFAQRELDETVTAYARFLDERLLWIRSGDPPSWEMVRAIGQRLAMLLSPAHWWELARALVLPGSIPWLLILGLLVFGLLWSQRGRLLAVLESSGRNVGQLRHDRLSATLRAVVVTLVLALPWPLLFTVLGLHLQYAHQDQGPIFAEYLYPDRSWTGQFVPAVGAAFHGIAIYSFYFFALRLFCTPVGVAAVHFGWNPETCEQLSRAVRRLMWIFLPAGFVLLASVALDPGALAGGPSRLAFFVLMGALAWFFGRILWPQQGPLSDYYRARSGSPWTWFRYLWFALGLLLPTGLALLSVSGYVYTAAQFGGRLIDTLWLIVALILIHQLIVRWILLNERRLAFKDALERHRAQRAARDAQAEGDDSASLVDEPMIDYSALSADTHKLVNTVLIVVGAIGLFAIWADVLPAFRILDEFSLWSYTSTVGGADKVIPVTLRDLILAALILVVGLVSAGRLPALMEILVFSRVNISAGSRYAIATLTQYVIVAAGIVMVFSLLGGNWSEIQWLIAALGVGIGFGLQEIVANFICGLILLFERPIRIGDIVTVGETTGVVTRIRIRSTTIRNWDQQELVVPNKEFITGRLLNWTLSDPIARIVIPVGVAYGSDVALAIRLVRASADAHERVLDDPEPLVTFDSFGDSALLITLRCYLGSMDYRLLTVSEINQDIERRFAEAGIVVAFPQRDIHLDTSQPLDVRLHPLPAGD